MPIEPTPPAARPPITSGFLRWLIKHFPSFKAENRRLRRWRLMRETLKQTR